MAAKAKAAQRKPKHNECEAKKWVMQHKGKKQECEQGDRGGEGSQLPGTCCRVGSRVALTRRHALSAFRYAMRICRNQNGRSLEPL